MKTTGSELTSICIIAHNYLGTHLHPQDFVENSGKTQERFCSQWKKIFKLSFH